MKTEDECHKAHDVLVAVILGDAPVAVNEETRQTLMCMASVLCWVLGHDHNQAFPEALAKIEAATRAAGFEPVRCRDRTKT